MTYISLRIDGADSSMYKKVKVYCLSNEREKEEYEHLINNEDVNILEETSPTVDKLGRVLITVK